MISLLAAARKIVLGILVVQFALLPEFAFAGRKIASLRGERSVKRVSKYPSNKELIKLYRQAALDALGRPFLFFATPEELRDFLLAAMSPKDREEMRPLLMRGVVKLTPRREGDALILTGEQGVRLTVRWPKFPRPTFEINGVDWTVSSHQSMKFNVEHLLQLLRHHGKNAGWMQQLFGPQEAHALTAQVTQFLLFVGAAVLGGLISEVIRLGKDAAVDYHCTAHYNDNETARTLCVTTLDKLAKAQEYIAKLSAVKNEVTVKKNTEASSGTTAPRNIWVPGTVLSCPSSKNQDVYVADVQLVKDNQGTLQNLGDWQTVKFELHPGTGKFKSGIVVPAGKDLGSPDVMDDAKASFVFDENGLKTLYVHNPQRDSVESPPMVPISMAKEDSTLSTNELAAKHKWLEMLSQVSILINSCIIAETKRKVDKAEEKQNGPKQPEAHPALPEGSAPAKPQAEKPAKTVN